MEMDQLQLERSTYTVYWSPYPAVVVLDGRRSQVFRESWTVLLGLGGGWKRGSKLESQPLPGAMTVLFTSALSHFL
jgi:hypothetical protein